MHKISEPTAVLSPEVNSFISQGNLKDIAHSMGTPFHAVFPAAVLDNVDSFRAAMSDVGVEGEVFFAQKANKSDAILDTLSSLDVGADVSSLYEQRAALASGIKSEKIGLSGPEKDSRQLALALSLGSYVTIDSPDELQRLIEISNTLVRPSIAKILLRMAPADCESTRFGMSASALNDAYDLLRASNVPLSGYAFHLSGYSPEQRATAAFSVFDEAEKGISLGFSPDVLNIGGGFSVAYLNEATWQGFVNASTDPGNFFKGRTFPTYYPYFSSPAGASALQQILLTEGNGNQKLADELATRKMKLIIEPGRALLDQAGISVFTVTGTKQASNEEWMVTVDGNMNHISEQWFGTDFVPSPVLVSTVDNKEISGFRASVSGNTCMENDMLTWRKINFPSKPQRGDLLVYPNTAGYMMDSNESEFHRLPIPPKIAAYRDKAGNWKWTKDELFSFLNL